MPGVGNIPSPIQEPRVPVVVTPKTTHATLKERAFTGTWPSPAEPSSSTSQIPVEKKSSLLMSKLNALFQPKTARSDSTQKNESVLEAKFVALKGHLKKAGSSFKDAMKFSVDAQTRQSIASPLQSARKVYDKLLNELDSHRSLHNIGAKVIHTAAQENTSIDVEDKKLQQTIQKAITKAAKSLNKDQTSLEVKVALNGKHSIRVIVTKHENKNVKVLLKGKLLGAGACGEVHRATDVITQDKKVVKARKEDVIDEEKALQDLHNEIAILKKLGSHAGIPPAEGHGDSLISEEYKGSLAKQVVRMDVAKYLGIPPDQLSGMSEQEIRNKIRSSLTPFVNEIKQLKQELNDLAAKNLDTSSKKKELESKMDQLGGFIALQTNHLFGEDQQRQFKIKSSKEVTDKLIDPNNTENPEDLINSVFGEQLFQIGVKCKEMSSISFQQQKMMASQLLQGLLHTFGKDILHGDIKPDNILWKEGEAVIWDWGTAQEKDATQKGVSEGTNGYRVDSYVDAMKEYAKLGRTEDWFKVGQAIDMRAMGISLYQLFTGKSPPSSANIYNPKTYENMEIELIAAGLDEMQAGIIKQMCQPLEHIDTTKPFELPISLHDLDDLASILR